MDAYPNETRELNNHTPNKASIMLALLTVGMMGVILGLLLYWSCYPKKIFEVTKVTFINKPEGQRPTYYQGETVTLDITYNKYYPYYANIGRFLIKQDMPNRGLYIAVIATTMHGNLPVGLNQQGRITFIIPLTTPPGVYYMVSSITYWVNPLRPDFPHKFKTPEFIVEEK